MATLLDLEAQGAVDKIDAALESAQLEIRRIYALPRARAWFQNVLPELNSDWDLESSPLEQLDDLLATFCLGEVLTFERQLRPLQHIDNGIWELKTPDLRLFGWFAMRDCFICSSADSASRVKKFKLYGGYRDQAVRDREQMDLDEPKFIAGDDPDAVVSNFSYP